MKVTQVRCPKDEDENEALESVGVRVDETEDALFPDRTNDE